MKKWLIILGLLLIIATPLLFHFRPFFFKKNAGLEVNCQPAATIFLDGKHLGQTPFKEDNLQTGDYLLKLTPTIEGLSVWEKTVSLNSGSTTVINCQLAVSEEQTSSTILTLESLNNKKLMVLAVISQPDGVMVKVDGVTRGFAPISSEDIKEGDHLVSLTLNGYQKKEIKAKTMPGRKLIINAQLAKEKVSAEEAAPSAEPETTETYVVIKETPTGWLRVRWEPSLAATEAAKIQPGEKYSLLDEQSGWYKIEFEEGQEGWIASQYATLNL